MVQRHVSHPSRSLRLVVETDDPALAISDFACFRDAGFDVVVCGGPDDDHPCPAVSGVPCRDIEQADVVFNAIRDAKMQLAFVRAVRRTHDTPMVVSAFPEVSSELPEGCVSVSQTASVNGQTDAVRRAAFTPTHRHPR